VLSRQRDASCRGFLEGDVVGQQVGEGADGGGRRAGRREEGAGVAVFVAGFGARGSFFLGGGGVVVGVVGVSFLLSALFEDGKASGKGKAGAALPEPSSRQAAPGAEFAEVDDVERKREKSDDDDAPPFVAWTPSFNFSLTA